MRKLLCFVMSLMIATSSFASSIGHQQLAQIMDEMNYDLSQSATDAEREQLLANYENKLLEAFSMMSDDEIAEFSKELFSKVPVKMKADLDLLFSTIDFDKLTKEEKLRLIQETAARQYKKGASWDGEEFFGNLFMGLVIVPIGIIVLFYGLTCGPSHNCDK